MLGYSDSCTSEKPMWISILITIGFSTAIALIWVNGIIDHKADIQQERKKQIGESAAKS